MKLGQTEIISAIILAVVALSLAATAYMWVKHYWGAKVSFSDYEYPTCNFDPVTRSYVANLKLINSGPGVVNVTKEELKVYINGVKIPSDMVVIRDKSEPRNFLSLDERFDVKIMGLTKGPNKIIFTLGPGWYGGDVVCVPADVCYSITGVWSQKMDNDPVVNVKQPSRIIIEITGVEDEYCKK